MADIIEKSLNLAVQGEDLATDVFSEIGDNLSALLEQAQTVFGEVGMAGEDAASVLADSAELFTPAWMEQLELLVGIAAGAFNDILGEAESAGAGVAGSGASVAAPWVSGFTEISSEAKIASGDVKAAFGSDALGLDSAGGALTALKTGFDEAATSAKTAGGDIKAAFSTDALGVDAAGAGLKNLQGQFGTTADDAKTAADAIKKSFSTNGLAVDAGAAGLKGLQDDFATTARDAKTSAGDISKSWSTNTLGLDAGKVSLTELQEQMDATVKVAKTDAAEIAAAFDAGGAAAGKRAAAGAVGTEEAGAGLGAAAIKSETKAAEKELSSFFKVSLSGILTGGITGALGLGAVGLGIDQIEQLGQFASQTGMSVQQAVQTQMAASGVHLSQTQLSALSGRLQKQLQAAAAQGPVELAGQPISEGLGRSAINPSTETALTGVLGSKKGAGAALQLLGINPASLEQLPTNEQFAVLAQKLDEIKNANVRTATAEELFGGKNAINVIPLLNEYQQMSSKASTSLSTPGGKQLIQDLQSELGTSGKGAIGGYQENLYMVELEMSTALVKLTPALELLAKEVALLVDALAHPGSKKSLETIGEDALALVAGVGTYKAAKKVVTKGASTVAKKGSSWLGDLFSGAEDAGGKVLGKAGSAIGDFGGAAGDILGPLGVAATTLAFPSSTSKGADTINPNILAIEKAAAKYGINPAGLLADSYAESSLIPNRVEGSTIANPTQRTKNSTSDASGLFQFTSGTWKSDYEKLYGKDPTKKNAGDYSATVQADVAAYAMKHAKVGTQSDPTAALTDIVTRFEKPGAKGAASDISTGTKFLTDIDAEGKKAETAAKKHTTTIKTSTDKDMASVAASAKKHGDTFADNTTKAMTKAETAAKKSAPTLPASIDTALKDLVKLAKTHGDEFDASNKKMLDEAETYLKSGKAKLTTVGEDLLKGLLAGMKKEEPKLTGYAKSLAASLESVLRVALQTHSPSEMTAVIGEDLMAGLGVGIDRSTPGVAAGAARRAHQVAGALAGAGGGPGGGGQFILEATIPVYVDGHLLTQQVMRETLNTVKSIAKLG